MLNKNTLSVKKSTRPIRSSIVNRYVRPKTLISAEAKKLLIKNLLNYFHNYDWLCRLATFLYHHYQRWPSDKANHSYENML